MASELSTAQDFMAFDMTERDRRAIRVVRLFLSLIPHVAHRLSRSKIEYETIDLHQAIPFFVGLAGFRFGSSEVWMYDPADSVCMAVITYERAYWTSLCGKKVEGTRVSVTPQVEKPSVERLLQMASLAGLRTPSYQELVEVAGIALKRVGCI